MTRIIMFELTKWVRYKLTCLKQFKFVSGCLNTSMILYGSLHIHYSLAKRGPVHSFISSDNGLIIEPYASKIVVVKRSLPKSFTTKEYL